MLGATTRTPTPTPPLPPVLAEVDRIVREGFWDPKLKGVDWKTAVARAARELAAARTPSERDAVYDALLAGFQDSHTFRLPAGRIPPRDWGTAGLRIGAQGEGYVITGVIPGSPADRAGLRLGDRVLAVDGKPYGRERVNFRDLFLVFEGPVGSTLRLSWSRPPDSQPHEAALIRTLEEPGDALVWKSARIIRRDGKAYGYAHLWGLSAQTALAVVDLLSGDYWLVTREARRLIPPEYRALPVALLVNSGTASAGEILALQFRRHGIGPIVGERTSGMASGGASPHALSDGSTLWLSSGSLEDTQGVSYEGRGIAPDVTVPDRPPAAAGEEDAVVEAAIRALAGAVKR